MKELLASKTSVGPHEIIIPIHGPKVTTDTIVEALKGEFSNTRATIFHLDISPSVRNDMSSTAFYSSCQHIIITFPIPWIYFLYSFILLHY